MRVVITTVIYDSTASASHLRHGLDVQGRAYDMQLSILEGKLRNSLVNEDAL